MEENVTESSKIEQNRIVYIRVEWSKIDKYGIGWTE